ncbi:hypothetical protein IGB42_01867 [Andreprevotia sp. IGB-42]|uniref:portal protein n=1 Tax=Andreprevotia sp. IGB-42 TaxID=2497473 RepID=UPI001358A6CA|nr:hypothetical protein [Andreprevotia sp. IGB-42]KAF0813516.1 hypothetical protein IGB42_01867 [Andreprevotia sp. IGB-42]
MQTTAMPFAAADVSFDVTTPDQPFSEAESERHTEQQQIEFAERLSGLGQRLQGQADKLVAARRSVETRMLADLRQYNGLYDPDQLSSIEVAGGSKAFVNMTRAKCNALESRLGDGLLPSDGNNWAITPTPMPELNAVLGDDTVIGYRSPGAMPGGPGMVSGPAMAGQMGNGPGMPPNKLFGQPANGAGQAMGQPVQARDMARQRLDDAADRAARMQTLMADQLAECDYSASLRDVIHDAVVLGTGVLKGPVAHSATTTRFQKVEEAGATFHLLVRQAQIKPVAERVDPFEFFPDLSAQRIEDAEFAFQRHYLTRKQLRELARQDDFLKGQIRQVLLESERPSSTVPSHLAEMREMASLTGIEDKRYQLWEYHGPIQRNELEACGCAGLPEEDDPDYDPFAELQACIWFTEHRVIKASLSPLDDGRLPYAVYTLETDGTSLFGTGVPYAMRHTQRVLNACFRAMLDNASLSAKPQVLIDIGAVQGADGDYTIKPGKSWVWDSRYASTEPFRVVPIQSNLTGMMGLFNLASQLLSEETGVYPLQQGDQTRFLNETATGAAIAANSMSTLIGRLVKRFDDGVTKPFIRALYHWNMLHADDEKVKGDCNIVARGVSALLEKETQTNGLMQMLQMAGHPVVGPFLNPEGLVEEISRVMRLPKSVLKTPEQMAQQQQQAPGPDAQAGHAQAQQDNAALAQAKLQLEQARLQLQQQELQWAAQERQLQHQEFQQDQAGDMQRHHDQIAIRQAGLQEQQARRAMELTAQQQMQRERTNADNQRFNTEVALKLQNGSGI